MDTKSFLSPNKFIIIDTESLLIIKSSMFKKPKKKKKKKERKAIHSGETAL